MVATVAAVLVLAAAAVLGLVSIPEAATTLVALGFIAVAIGVLLSVFVAVISWLTGVPE